MKCVYFFNHFVSCIFYVVLKLRTTLKDAERAIMKFVKLQHEG
jgi:hypothetical protein